MEAAEISKQKTRDKISTLANELISYSWNSTSRPANAARLLKILGPNVDNVNGLKEFLKKEKLRMNKESQYEFNRWYGEGIIETLNLLIKTTDKFRTDKTILSTDILVGNSIVRALESNHEYHEFNWKNDRKLHENGLHELIGNFETYFRGDIDKCHKIKDGEYLVIECKRHPYDYDKQRTKFHEPEEISFYAFSKNEDETYHHTSTCYHTFEEALFSVICPQYSDAITALFESQNK